MIPVQEWEPFMYELVDYTVFRVIKVVVGKLVYFPMNACCFGVGPVEFGL